MADRRTEDASTAPPPGTRGDGLTERINQAYAESAPVVRDDRSRTPEISAAEPRKAGPPAARSGSEEAVSGPSRTEEAVPGPPRADEAPSGRPTAGERFAAAVGAARTGAVQAASEAAGRGQGPRPAGAGTTLPGSTVARGPRRVRKARLRLTHIDPWSVMKTSFLLSVALGIVIVVAVGIVWSVLDAAGVWESINNTVGEVVGESGSGFNIEEYVGMSRVMGFTLIVAAVDVVLVTVIATLGAFLYNLAAALLGGLEVVLAEEDH